MGGEETFMAGYGESICANCSYGFVCALCFIYEILLVTSHADDYFLELIHVITSMKFESVTHWFLVYRSIYWYLFGASILSQLSILGVTKFPHLSSMVAFQSKSSPNWWKTYCVIIIVFSRQHLWWEQTVYLLSYPFVSRQESAWLLWNSTYFDCKGLYTEFVLVDIMNPLNSVWCIWKVRIRFNAMTKLESKLS